MAVKNLAPTLSSAFLAAISPSRTLRRSSGSVPSMPICRPRLRNGSSISLTCASRASRPSLRAFSARVTSVWMRSVIGGTFGGRSACLNQPPIFLTSAIDDPAMAAPKVPPKTSSSGGSRMIAIGLEPSRIIVTSSATVARAMPIRVAGSMRSALLAGGEGHDGRAAVLHRGDGGGVLPAVHLVAGGEDRRAVLPDLLEHLVHALLDHVLGAVHEEGDRVGVALDPLDQVGVEREPLSVQARHTDHGWVLLLGVPGKGGGGGCTVLFGSPAAFLEPNTAVAGVWSP